MAPLVAALGAAANCTAWAEPNPYYIGASESFTHTTNAFGTADDLRSDNYWTTSLLGGFDQQIGRQRIYGTGNVNRSNYQNQTTLNNTSYGLNTGLDWNTVYQLAGSVNVSANQSLANITDNANLPISARNVLRTEQASTSVQWGGASVLSLVSSFSYSRVNYSAPQYFSSQSHSNSESLGVNYNISPDIQAGIAYRLTSSDSPYGVYMSGSVTDPNSFTSNSTDGKNIDLTVNWHTSARTSFSGRLSRTEQSNSNASGLNFSGLTGFVAGNYAATGKINLNLSYNRDAGSNGSLFNAPVSTPIVDGTTPTVPITGLAQNSQVTNSFSLGAAYAATAKVSANVNLQYRRSLLVNTFASGGIAVAAGNSTDNSKTATLGVNYAAGRVWNLGCNASRTLRNVTGIPDYSYNSTSYGCSAQITLR